MRSRWTRSRTPFLAVMLTAALFLGAAVPDAHAWNMSVNPMSRSTVPGGTVTYTVAVFYDTPTDALFPSVLLLVSPPEPGVSVTFTYDNPDPHPPPYTATMTVHVDSSKPPGTYTLYLWANPSGTPFPGPGNRQVNVNLVVSGGAKVHLSVPHSPLSVNQPVYIEYYTDPGADGMITLMITRPPLLGILWTKGPEPITGGLLYDVTAPGFDTPGTYHLGATVELSAGGSINGETTFEVRAGAVFDFTIAFSPSTVEVDRGETAHYRVLLTYSDPSYFGTVVNIQLSGLGSGMDSHLTEAGDLTVRTSSTTPTGTYTIIAIGSAMGVTRQASATLVVMSGQPPPSQFDFGLSVSPTERTVTPGSSATFTVTVNLAAGSAQNVALSLSGQPAGVLSATFDPPSDNPTYASTLALETTSSISPGSYSLTVTGTGGGKTRTAIISLIVSKTGEFRLEAAPASEAVSQGETASYSVRVVSVEGFDSAVSLQVSGLPSGVTGVLSAPSGTPDFSSTLTVTVSRYAQTGSFTLTITGTSGDLTRIANVVLIVNPAKTTMPPPTQTKTTTSRTGSGLSEVDFTWITIGILVVLIVVFAVLAFRRRRATAPQPPPPAQPAPPAAVEKPGPSPVYCVHCGTENPSTNQFCGKCGKKLLRE